MNNSVVSEPYDYLNLAPQFSNRRNRVSESPPSYTQSVDAGVQQYDGWRNHWAQAPPIIGEALAIPLKVPHTSSKPRKDRYPSDVVNFNQPYWWKEMVTEVTPGVSSRRRAQNRASQRAFRERKDRRMKELESKLKDTVAQCDKLRAEYDAVVAAYLRLKGEVDVKETEEKKEAQIELRIAICKKCFSGTSSVQSLQVGFENHDS